MTLRKIILFDVENKYNMPAGFGVAQLIIAGLIGFGLYLLMGHIGWYAQLSELMSINFIKALTSPLTFILFCCFFDLAYSHRDAFKVACKTMLFIVITTGFAATVGLFFAWFTNPLQGIDLGSFITSETSSDALLKDIPFILEPLFAILQFTKTALTYFAAYTEISILYILIIAIAPVVILHFLSKSNQAAHKFLDMAGKYNNIILEKIIFKWLKIVIAFLPITMIFIISWFFGKVTPEQMSQYGGMLTANLLSIVTQQFLVLIGLTFITGPWVLKFALQLFPAYFTALSTRSSVATMEVTMALSERAGINHEYREFVIPFGATVNMNGTAAHVGFWICALAFALHPDLSIFWLWFFTVLYVIMTAMGTAAIPGGSIALLKKAAPAVFASAIGVDIPEVQLIGLIGLITVFDIVGDAFRTQANVFGDTMCMAWLEKDEPAELRP